MKYHLHISCLISELLALLMRCSTRGLGAPQLPRIPFYTTHMLTSVSRWLLCVAVWPADLMFTPIIIRHRALFIAALCARKILNLNKEMTCVVSVCGIYSGIRSTPTSLKTPCIQPAAWPCSKGQWDRNVQGYKVRTLMIECTWAWMSECIVDWRLRWVGQLQGTRADGGVWVQHLLAAGGRREVGGGKPSVSRPLA